MIVWLLVWVIVFSMWPLGPVMIYILAMRTSAPRPWRAFVPIADVFLIARMGRKYSISTVISGLLLPLWGTFLWFCYWSDIAEEMRKPGWLGFLMLVPGLRGEDLRDQRLLLDLQVRRQGLAPADVWPLAARRDSRPRVVEALKILELLQ